MMAVIHETPGAAAPTRGQSKRMSALEAVANVAIGYVIAVAAQHVIFPWFGWHAPLSDHLLIGAAFTVVSLARSYVLRRGFDLLHTRWA